MRRPHALSLPARPGYNSVSPDPMTDEIVVRARRAPAVDHDEGDDPTGEIRKLSSLVEISQALSSSLNLAASLPVVLEILERYHSVVRAAVYLLDEESGDLYVKAAVGPENLARAAQAGRRHGRPRRRERAGRGGAAGEPRAAAAGARASPPARAQLRVRAARRQQEDGGRASAAYLTFKRDRQYHRSLKFFRVVGVDDVAGGEGQRGWPKRRSGGWSRRTRTCATSCATATRSATSSATARRSRQVYEQVAQVARTNTTVLIRGESGTGKEMIAHAIHYNSPRAKKPFIKVSCAALPDIAHRVGAVRLREGRVHRRAGAQEGPVRARRRRHAVPRRDRRPEPDHAGEAAAGAAGARDRAARRHAGHPHQRAADRRHPPHARRADRRRACSARISSTG